MSIVYTIFRSFLASDSKTLVNLYKVHVRPILEYNTSIWNPNIKSDIISIENVQRRFTKRLCQRNNINFNSYSDRLKILNLETLEIRRIKIDIILMFKIFNNLIDANFEEHFRNSVSIKRYDLRGHKNRLFRPKYSGSSPRNNFLQIG